MSRALIWYNISYYAKTLKFIAPCMVFIIWHFSIHTQTPVPIWSQYYLTALATFVLANWIGTSFINSEDRTQGYITRLHVKSENAYHLTKIATILILMIPFYAIMIFYPMIFGFFVRSLLITEIIAVVAIHFLFSLMGAAVSILFDTDFYNQNSVLPLQVLVVLVLVVPFATIFDGNVFVQYATYLLPPVNFFGDSFHALDSGVFVMDSNFLIFVLYALGYSLILITIYTIIIKKKNKQ